MFYREHEYVRAVVQYRSVTRASEQLNITPAALSKYIKKIESDLGVQLFHRIGKTLEPTYAAERYLAWMDQMRLVEEDMYTELKDISSLKTGSIHLGVMNSTVDFVVHKTVPAFLQEYPDVQLHVEENTSPRLRDAVNAGKLDFAILTTDYLSPTMRTIHMKSIHKVLLVAKDHPLLKTAVSKPGFPYPWVDLSRFAGENYISPFQEFDEYLGYPDFPAKYGFYPRIICRMRTFRTAAWSVSKGIGVAVAPDQMVRKECIGDLPIARLSFGETPLATDALYLAYRKGHYLSRAAQYFIALCEKAYAED